MTEVYGFVRGLFHSMPLCFSFIALTEELLHEISLVEVVGSTLNMCFLGYYTMMVWILRRHVWKLPMDVSIRNLLCRNGTLSILSVA